MCDTVRLGLGVPGLVGLGCAESGCSGYDWVQVGLVWFDIRFGSVRSGRGGFDQVELEGYGQPGWVQRDGVGVSPKLTRVHRLIAIFNLQ